MAKQWTCARCSTKNDEGTLTCTNCRMIRGAVVVPGTWNANPDARPPSALPAGAAEPRLGPSSWGAAGLGYPVSEPTASQPLGRRMPIGWLIFVIVLGIGAVASFVTNASRSDTGEIVNDGDMMATDLRVGDCFDVKDPSADEVTDVTAKPCTEPHEFELFWTGSMPDGAYPTQAAFESFFQTHCVGGFEPYVGKGYLDSQLDIYWLTPFEETWDAGDQSIQCAAYDPNDNQLIGSVKATAR